MNNDSENHFDLRNYPPSVNELDSWQCRGTLSWKNDSWKGNAVLTQLLNERLPISFQLEDVFGRSEILFSYAL